MSPAEYVIKIFGGVRPLSRIINKHPSTISYWKKRGSKTNGNIPSSVHVLLLKEAHKRDLDLTASDLILGRK